MYVCTAFVSSRICLESASSCSFWPSSSCTVCHCWFASTWRFSSARFWLIITNVERKIASSETIIVSRPKGYDSTPSAIQSVNQMTCIQTNVIEPLNLVMRSASRLLKLVAR